MQLVATPLTAEQFTDWQAHHTREYARDKVASGAWNEDDALARAEADNATLLPNGLETTGHHIRRVEAAETHELIGWIWVGLPAEGPGELAWLYDIEIVPAHRGQGHGRAVMALAENEARQLGCTRLGLHVFAANAVARQLYESCGFEVTDYCYAKTL